MRTAISNKLRSQNYIPFVAKVKQDPPTFRIRKNYKSYPIAVAKNGYQKIDIVDDYDGQNHKYKLQEYILKFNDLHLIRLIVNVWFANQQHNIPFDVQLNLLHYMIMSPSPYQVKFTDEELHYIANASPQQLLKMLGKSYQGPIDHASLLFAILSGTVAPYPNVQDVQDRYDVVKEYPLDALFHILKLYKYDAMSYPPHIFIALQTPYLVEPLIGTVNEDNVDAYI